MPSYNWFMHSDTSVAFTYDLKSKPTFGVGPSVKYYISDNLNFDVAVVFGSNNFTINQNNEPAFIADSVNISEDIKLKFVDVPINFNGQFDIIENLQGIINFGATIGFVTSSTRLIKDNYSILNSSDYSKFSNILPINFALVGGAGVDYELTRNLHITFTAQYKNGVPDIWLDEDGATFPSQIDNLVLKNRGVIFNFGFYVDF